MRATCLFICLSLYSFLSTAQNNLIVLDENGREFFLFVDDKQINDSAQAEVKVRKIYEDTCRIKAVFTDKAISEFSGKVYLMESARNVKNREFTYRLSGLKGKVKLNFVSANDIFSDTTAKPQSISSKINSIFITEAQKKEDYAKLNGIYPTPEPCKKAITDSMIQKKILLLRENHIELNRIKDAKWFISHNCINAAQLKRLFSAFDYRHSKVEIGEFAFDYMEDHRNFLDVVEGIEASLERNELKKFYDKRIEK
jgi:hypothetical protein